jgi:multidrug transporter EmrE-like cation transporter
MAFIFCTVVLTVYCQLMVKWRVRQAGAVPIDLLSRLTFLAKLLLDPWMITVALAALLAGLSWFMVMARYELSYAYPFMSLAFVFVLLASAFFFHEDVTLPKVLGLLMVIMGLLIASQ